MSDEPMPEGRFLGVVEVENGLPVRESDADGGTSTAVSGSAG